jgi:hypothetical protein
VVEGFPTVRLVTGSTRTATRSLGSLVRLAGDYLLLPALGLVVVVVATDAVEAHYTPLGLARPISRVDAGTTVAAPWNVAATAAVMTAVYVDAVLQRAYNE